MKQLKKIICIVLVLLILVNTILPRVSFALASTNSYEQETAFGLMDAIGGEFKNKVKEKIKQDKQTGDEAFITTKQFLQEANDYMQELYNITEEFYYNISSDNNSIAELIVDLKNIINGLNNYFEQSYVDFLLKKLNTTLNSTEMNRNASYFLTVGGATTTLMLEYIDYDGIINEELLKEISEEIGNEYIDLNDEQQVDAIIKDIYQKITSKIESLTSSEEDIKELEEYIQELMAKVDQENVSDDVKAKVKEKMLDAFYTDGEVDIIKTQSYLATHLTIPIEDQVYANAGDDIENWGTSLGGILNIVFGILVYPWKLIFIVPGLICNLVLTEIASVGSGEVQIVTLETILFNDLSLTDVNIFSTTKTANGQNVTEIIQTIRENVAGWYYAFRNLAIVASLAVMIYVGIRMALDNFGAKKAKYKQMLMNWFIGFGLIFLLHYIIIIVLNVNSILVKALSINQISDGAIATRTDFMNSLLEMSFGISLAQSWGAAIMYSILLVITLVFLIIYIKRMLMVCFLVMVAPIITITYAIDKTGNSKSEILNSWLKEFCYNVLIQPFHCITYNVFVGTAMKIMYEAKGLPIGQMIFAIVCILCIFIGEKLIRTIFGFTKSSSVADKLFTGSMVTKTISDVKTIKQSQGQTEEEEEAPELMPDGKQTDEVMVSGKVKLTSEKTVEVNSKQETKKLKDTTKENKNMQVEKESKAHKAKRKIDEKTPMLVKGATRAYTKGLKSVTGYNALQSMQEKAERRKRPKLEEQFIMASEIYQKRNKLTDKQLALKMEALGKTSMKDLTDPTDILYKEWIDYAQKGFNKQGKEKPTSYMRQLILNKDMKGENASKNS